MPVRQTLASLFASCAVASLLSLVAACDDGDEDLEFADATYALTTPTDCEAAFSGSYLGDVAAERGWTESDIAAFCAEVGAIADTYADNATFTTVTLAGVGQIDDDALETAYFVGVAGYDLDAVKDWAEAAAGAQAVRRCARAARSEQVGDGTLPDGYVTDCLADETGMAFPEPLFRETRSDVGIDEVGDAGAGNALSLAIYQDPDQGTVVAFLGGRFYAQAAPTYGAFLGCGAALGFDNTGREAGAAVCVGVEYAE